jgi:hypothetical protein
MSNSIKHLINQFDLQTRLFNNVTKDIKDSDSTKRMNGNTNHIAWLTGHLVSSRYNLGAALGITDKEPYPALFENRKGMDKNAKYPSMQDLTKDWDPITKKISAKLNSLTEDVLNTKMPSPVPTGETLGDLIAFLMHHEAYTIGQLGIYRRFHGQEAMSYK